jgi:hypothetical protein
VPDPLVGYTSLIFLCHYVLVPAVSHSYPDLTEAPCMLADTRDSLVLRASNSVVDYSVYDFSSLACAIGLEDAEQDQ